MAATQRRIFWRKNTLFSTRRACKYPLLEVTIQEEVTIFDVTIFYNIYNFFLFFYLYKLCSFAIVMFYFRKKKFGKISRDKLSRKLLRLKYSIENVGFG